CRDPSIRSRTGSSPRPRFCWCRPSREHRGSVVSTPACTQSAATTRSKGKSTHCHTAVRSTMTAITMSTVTMSA
ncbi:MAG: hypothetical protein AVDCRST_MAG68-2783, partial [uncultured Gemmatimonadetes bacterium]